MTLSIIKAEIGFIDGHICPSQRLLDSVRAHIQEHGKDLLLDNYISYAGDDIAIAIKTHRKPQQGEPHGYSKSDRSTRPIGKELGRCS